jgi:hypothetical protein
MISLNETFIFIFISLCLFKFITLFPIIFENLSFKTTGLEKIFFKGGNAIILNRTYDEFYTK